MFLYVRSTLLLQVMTRALHCHLVDRQTVLGVQLRKEEITTQVADLVQLECKRRGKQHQHIFLRYGNRRGVTEFDNVLRSLSVYIAKHDFRGPACAWFVKEGMEIGHAGRQDQPVGRDSIFPDDDENVA